MKKIIGLMLAGAIFTNIGAYAFAQTSVKVELHSTQYHISGTFDKAEFNKTAFFSVKDSEGNIIHFDGIATKNDGSFEYYFTMPKSAPTGKYTFLMSGYDSTEAMVLSMGEESEITYINPNDIEDALEAVDEESKKENGNLKGVIEENKYKLLIAYNKFAAYYDGLPSDNKTLLAQSVKSGAPYNKDINKFDAVFYKALALQALRAAEKTKIETTMNDFADYYKIENENTYQLYEKLDTYKALVLEKFAGTLTSYEDFDKSFNEACILVGVYKLNTWGEVAETLRNYKNDIPFVINESDINIVAKAVAGKEYKDMAELKTAAENAVKKPSGGGSGGGGSSSGGGGGSSSKNSGGAVYPVSTEIHNDLTSKSKLYEDLDEAAWAKDAIEYLSEKNIMSGYDGKVYPNKAVTREEFVRMVLDAFGLFEDGKDVVFSDVDTAEWSYKYIACAADKGIVHGISDEIFGKGMQISRQDMAVIIMRAMQAAGKTVAGSNADIGFSDSRDIAGYALDSVGYMTEHGFLNGFEDGSFRPLESATRAQAARILYAILNEYGEDSK